MKNEKPKMSTKDKVNWGLVIFLTLIIVGGFVTAKLFPTKDFNDPEFLKELIEQDQNKQRDLLK